MNLCLFFASYRKEILSLDKLEAQLKACNCRLVFSKAKVSLFLVHVYLTVSVLTFKKNFIFFL
jgi:cyclin G2